MNLAAPYHPNTERIAAKVMDGEAVIIDLVSGTYYSLSDTGGRIWQLIEAGLTRDEMADHLARDYDVARDRASTDLDLLLAKLAAEQLIVARAANADRAGGPVEPLANGGAYAAPELQVYRDMQDLLALDPPMPGLQDIPWR
jgi:hypothetical protein